MQTGRLRYAVIDLPLESLHGSAFRAAEMVRCAGEQGKYWQMRTWVFSNPQAVAQSASYPADLGLNLGRLGACVGSGKYAAEVRKDMAQAAAAGIEGTPSFILAATDKATGKLRTVRFLAGAQPFANFKAQIDAALEQQDGEKR